MKRRLFSSLMVGLSFLVTAEPFEQVYLSSNIYIYTPGSTEEILLIQGACNSPIIDLRNQILVSCKSVGTDHPRTWEYLIPSASQFLFKIKTEKMTLDKNEISMPSVLSYRTTKFMVLDDYKFAIVFFD